MPSGLKYMFYSSDFHGLGHISRTLKIAMFLAKNSKDDAFYILTNKIMNKDILENISIIKMPKININTRPRDCRYLDEVLPETKVWSDFLIEKINLIKPDIFYSDLNPNGGYGELRTVFPILKKEKIKTILGLRDILDDFDQTRKEWFNENNNILSIRDYDIVIVFGKKEVFESLYSNLIKNVHNIEFVGYILPEALDNDMEIDLDIFAMFGGGGKSKEQVEYISELLSEIENKKIVILTGPLFPQGLHEKLVKKYKSIEFVKETKNVEEYLSRSRITITHCGYNSIMESLLYANKIILFPRLTFTRKEQLYRAELFKKLGYCDYITENLTKLENIAKILSFLRDNSPKKDVSIESGLNENIIKIFRER